MFLSIALLLLPGVLAGPPAEWGCKPLNKLGAVDDDCVTKANFDGATWDISTKATGRGASHICIVSIGAEGQEKVKDFFVTAEFRVGSEMIFGGLTYNMKDTQHGNYMLLRMNKPGTQTSNFELGYIDNGKKQMGKMASNAAFANGGVIKVELLVQNGEETVYINGVKDVAASSYEPYYYSPGTIGIGLQDVKPWDLKVSGATLCNPVQCSTPSGGVISGGESYVDDEGKTCTCSATGVTCVCGSDTLTCGGGLTKWTDPDTCESKCIKPASYCSSSGDPHYRTFDGKYYDFHGMCSYQAASCGDFEVFFKNYDLIGRAPRYTGRLELRFNNEVFAIKEGYQATVGDDPAVPVQVPYVKTYTNGDRVEIVNNGQLEIRLYNKGRNPSVRIRANNAGRYVNAEMWLHGSCADVTEGLCGNANGNAGDDLINNNANTHGEHYKGYDENCPKPPKPYHPCDDVPNGYVDSEAICAVLKESPFAVCNDVVDIGNEDEGIMKNCQTDVCNCWIDETCACNTYNSYASLCINAGIDLSNWREGVEYCPYDCPDGLVYNARGPNPSPSCLNKDPEQDGTVRGCFCAGDKLLQDGVCVDPSQCKCLFEGQFYNLNDEIRKEGECLLCKCQAAGEMACEDIVCPDPQCDDNELVVYKDDQCCPYCDDNWVVAINPDVTIKKGQDVVLTCEIRVEGVFKKDITWYKDGQKITKGFANNKRNLKIKNGGVDDRGVYTCSATKDGKVGEDTFELKVIMPAICEHADGKTWEEDEIYKPSETEECTCDAQGEYECACVDDDEECKGETPVLWFADDCTKTCVPEPGVCSAAADPHYTSFDGTQFDFKGDCKYNFFSSGDVAIYADHEKGKASTETKYLEVVFKQDVYKLEGDVVTLNGEAVAVPMHKTYADGTVIDMTNVGNYLLTITQDGKDPLIELTWDKKASYSVKVHGTSKGDAKGLCGSWNDNADDDFMQPDGKVADTPEAFGTSWALDDEEDCPEPIPPPDLCEDFGVDRAAPTKHFKQVLGAGVLGKCGNEVDQATTLENSIQEYCGCFGDVVCACVILDQYALQCEQAGFDTSNWKMDNKFTECEVDCPTGTTFNAKGPKPPPSCTKPAGGRKTQKGCFCNEDTVMEDGVCIDKGECKCEYAGVLYDVGDKYQKEGECKDCECVGAGQEQCGDMACKPNCAKDEIEVEVEGQCCPECFADWVTPVNPDAVGKTNQPLDLVCEVNGIAISKGNVKWIKFNPGETDITNVKKPYSVSADGLTLTIKKMSEERVGNYKCVVEKDGKQSEGVFEVKLPILHEDLIEPVDDSVAFIEGGELILEVKKLGEIKGIYWECKGEKVTKSMDRINIINKNTFNRLVIKPAVLADIGTCTCYAEGVGTEDSAEIAIKGEENEVTVTPVNPTLECKENKKGCKVQFTCSKANGQAVKKTQIKICKLVDGAYEQCREGPPQRDGQWYVTMGKKTPKSSAGEWVCIVTDGGEEIVSDPCVLTVI